MDTARLEYFCALYDTKSYTEAARRCFISRQAVQQAVRALQRQYGVTLVEVQGNSLHLTEAAGELRLRAGHILEEEKELSRAMDHFLTSDRTVTVGISRSIIPFYAPGVLAAADSFAGLYPNLNIRFSITDPDEIYQQLMAGQLDAGILVDMGEDILRDSADSSGSGMRSFAPGPVSQEPPAPVSADAQPVPEPSGSRSGHTRHVLREDTMSVFMSRETSGELAVPGYMSLADLDGRTFCVMGDPNVFLRPLTQALQERHADVRWHTAVEYYEAQYMVREQGAMAIDRYENSLLPDLSPEVELPLEGGRYHLYCCLYTTGIEDTAMQVLWRHLRSTHVNAWSS